MSANYQNRNRSQYDGGQVLLAEADLTANAAGLGIDIGENVEIEVVSKYRGVLNNADNTMAVAIEESDDNVTFSALGNMVTLTNAITEDKQMFRTTKRYVRGDFTVAGTGPDIGSAEVYLVS